MKCDRCGTEMTEGIAIPSVPEGVLCDPGRVDVTWPFEFTRVKKCPSCGRSLNDWEIERRERLRRE